MSNVPVGAGDDLLIILAGLGAVGTTLVAGAAAYRRRDTPPDSVWSLAQAITDETGACVPVREALAIPPLSAVRFAAFDRSSVSALTQAERAGVLSTRDLEGVRDELAALTAVVGVTDASLRDTGIWNGVDYVRTHLRAMIAASGARRAVLLLALPTEDFDYEAGEATVTTLAALDAAAAGDGAPLSASVVYTMAALAEGIPVGNLTPNRTMDLPGVQLLAARHGLPVAGNDLKTGQTFLKSVLAPALLDRGLRIAGWFGANILGNEDGLNLKNERALASKLRSKSDPLKQILRERGMDDRAPEVVRIDYYPPRGDNKESWDCIDFNGWLDYPMSVRVNFHCRDSILAAPLALDVALLLDAARRGGLAGPQEWLASFFKAPVKRPDTVRLAAGFPDQMMLLEQGAAALQKALQASAV